MRLVLFLLFVVVPANAVCTAAPSFQTDLPAVSINDASLTVASAGGANAATAVSWWLSSDGGVTFIQVVAGGNYKFGSGGYQLQFAKAVLEDQHYFYANISNTCGWTKSTTTLECAPGGVPSSLTPSDSPVLLLVGSPVTMSAGAANAVSVTWTYQPNSTSGFIALPGAGYVVGGDASTSTLSISSYASSQNNYAFRATFCNCQGCATTTSIVIQTCTISPPSISTNLPATYSSTNGVATLQVVTTSGANQGTDGVWFISTDLGLSFQPIDSDGTIFVIDNSQAGKTKLTINQADGYTGAIVYAQPLNCAGSVTSSQCKLCTAAAAPVIAKHPASLTLPSGQTAVLSCTATSVETVVWQFATPSAPNTWTNVSTNPSVYTQSGTDYTTLSFTVAPSLANYSFRVLVSNCRPGVTTSLVAVLTIGNPGVLYGASPDLPNPPGLGNVPDFLPGSIIIPMDNIHQCKDSVDSCTASSPFNLMAYGLIERILWLGYKAADFNQLVNMPPVDFDQGYSNATGTLGLPRPIYWVIRSGKLKDEPDVSNVFMRKVSPCLNGTVTSTSDNWANFSKCTYPTKAETLYSSFFIIKQQDRFDRNGRDILEYIDFFNNYNFHFDPTSAAFLPAQNYAIPDRRKVAAYILNQTLPASAVTVRYVLTQRPLIGVMDSSGNNKLQVQVLNQALWYPYHRVVLSAAQVQAASNVSCYTILTEPHFDATTTGYLYTVPIHNFVAGGGNFFAQCHGVETYEDQYPLDGATQASSTNPVPGTDGTYYQGGIGNFMTKAGLSKHDLSASNPDFYYNADLAMAQFQGPGQLDQGGSLQSMLIDYAPTAGVNTDSSDWQWYSYGVMEQANLNEPTSGGPISQGTNQRGRWWRSRAAKYLPDPSKILIPGSAVFYMGGHQYTGLETTLGRTNMQRMYLNPMLVPASRPAGCRLSICNTLACDSRDCFGNCVNGVGCVNTNGCSGFCASFSSRIKISGSANSATIGAGASVFGDLYFNFANSSIAFEFYNPAATGWTAPVQRYDVLRTCQLARHVYSCGACVTLVDKRPMYRFFYEPQVDFAVAPFANPTFDPTFQASCPEYYQKGAAQSDPSAVKYIWGKAGANSTWNICAAVANDGTLYEFFKDKVGTRGVVLTGNITELNDPSTVYDFNKDLAWNCPASSCSAPVEVVFVIDEQDTISSGANDWGQYITFVESTINYFTVQGSTQFGAVFTNNSVPRALPNLLQNNHLSFYNAIESKRTQKAGGTTNWADTMVYALSHYWSSSSSGVPRKVIVLCGGPSAVQNENWASYQTLRNQLGVEVFAYGVGIGSVQTALLSQIATDAGHISTFAIATLLGGSQPSLAAAAVCPANDALCPSCNGWCCCAGTCCCPTCTGLGNPCLPSACNATKPQLGCVGQAVICNDNNVCTADACINNAGSAQCQYTPPPANACDDSNDCTTDGCSPQTGCYHTTIGCNDGNICTADLCNAVGGCQYVPQSADAAGCPASTACVSYACIVASGTCNATFLNCDDGDKCTSDSCDAVLGCIHTPTVPVSCSDGNACTLDGCWANACNHTDTSSSCTSPSICLQPVCLTGSGCTTTPYNSSYLAALCNDNDACTVDSCSNNSCVHDATPRGSCVANSNECYTFSCNSTTGSCESVKRVCNDNDQCTTDSCVVGVGCVYSPKNQTEVDSLCGVQGCRVSRCLVGSNQCTFPLDNSSSCACTNYPCTNLTFCSNPLCISSSAGCSALPSAYQGLCNNAVAGPAVPLRYCYDSPTSVCVPASPNLCYNFSCVNGAGTSGSCVASAIPCVTSDMCKTAVCTNSTGCSIAQISPSAAAAKCNDSNACSVDSCLNNQCLHDFTPNTTCASKSDACFTYACNAVTGSCDLVFTRQCNDNDICTSDVCNASQGGCVFTNKSATEVTSLCNPGSCQSVTCVSNSCRYVNITTGVCAADPCVTSPCGGTATFCSTPVCINVATASSGYSCASISNATLQSDCNANITAGGRYCYAVPTNACPASDACTIRTCNPAGSGSCDATPVVCPTPTDVCMQAACVLTGSSPGCTSQLKSAAAIATFCDDSNACSVDSCVSGGTGCVHDFAANTSCASQSNACFTYACNKQSGTCDQVGQLTCDDGKSCTIDSCNVTSGCVFANMSQAAINNLCQPPSCQVADCVGSSCVLSPDPSLQCACNAYPCGNVATFCTSPQCINSLAQCNALPTAVQDSCKMRVNGTLGTPLRFCYDAPTGVCNSLNDQCNTYTCNSTGSGSCDPTPVVCPPSTDICKDSVCGSSGCTLVPKSPAAIKAACDDSSDCTIDTCVSGACVHTNITCSTSDKCLKPVCNDVGGCSTVQKNAAEVALICNDSSLCTVDTCSNNQCIYTASVSCNASDACTSYACNPSTGVCDATSTNCTDASLCTVDTCDPFSGCVHSAIVCQDGKQCTSKTCDPLRGCVFTPDDSLCPQNTSGVLYHCAANGTCFSVLISCDDGNPCTVDTLTGGGCVYTPVSCQNFSACVPQVCSNVNGSAVCVDGTPLTCPPSDQCSTSTCDVRKGCVKTPIICPLDESSKCAMVDGCYLPGNAQGYPSGCRTVNLTSLFDFCGVCLGDNTACFFSSVIGAGAVGGIAGGAVAGIVVACVIAALLAAYASRKTYDYYRAKTDLNATGLNQNPFFKENSNTGIMPAHKF